MTIKPSFVGDATEPSFWLRAALGRAMDSGEPETTSAHTAPKADMLDLAPDRTEHRIARVTHTDQEVVLQWSDGRVSRFHAFWLRDNCPCARCRHPLALERTYMFIDHAVPRIAVAGLDEAGDLQVRFDAEGAHDSGYVAGWLRRHCPSAAARAEQSRTPRLWTRSEIGNLPIVDFSDYMSSDGGFRAWANALLTWGIVLIRNAPAEPGKLLEIARRAGPVRASNFGDHYDVISMPNPNASAYTAMALELHTDLANWRWPPDYQLLFCVRNDAVGGGSILADGFRVADDLRREEPEAFRLLAEHPVEFRFHDQTCDIAAAAPTIALDGRGSIERIRFNNWLRSSLSIPEDAVAPFYAALGTFWRRLRDPEYHLKLRLAAGEMLAYDNRRVLHGRESFDPNTGHRHLQGCYITEDDVLSKLRLLDR
jgi:gamma-butyrobetaine dioxygenase